MSRSESQDKLSCPSAQPDMADVRVIGVVEQQGDAQRIAYDKGREVVRPADLGPVPNELLGQVLRLAGRCESSRCAQFRDGKCGLGHRVASALPDVVAALPSCAIRNTCRWHAEQGDAVCFKCPQVVTWVPEDGGLLAEVARPGLPPLTSAR